MQVLEALWARFESQWYHDWLGLQAEKGGAAVNMSKRCAFFCSGHMSATWRQCRHGRCLWDTSLDGMSAALREYLMLLAAFLHKFFCWRSAAAEPSCVAERRHVVPLSAGSTRTRGHGTRLRSASAGRRWPRHWTCTRCTSSLSRCARPCTAFPPSVWLLRHAGHQRML